MTHTVCEPCTDCKYTDCVAVCPVEAIFAEANVPAQWQSYTPLNATKSAEIKAAGTGHITEKGDPKEGPGCKKKA